MRYGDERGPLVIAHRGGADLGPENTLSAFATSAALGVRYMETDIRLTADGELVCFHDETLDRCTTGSGRVAEHDFASLRRSARVAGLEPIPSLWEALETFPDTCFTIDLKDRAAIAPLARLLQRQDFAARVCVAGAWDGWLQLLASQVPDVRISLGWRSLVALISASKANLQPPASLVRGRFAHVPLHLGRLPIHSAELVRRAHRLGVRVVVWTVDDPHTMRNLLDMGVDGIISDRPDRLRALVAQRTPGTAAVVALPVEPAPRRQPATAAGAGEAGGRRRNAARPGVSRDPRRGRAGRRCARFGVCGIGRLVFSTSAREGGTDTKRWPLQGRTK